MYSRGMKHYFKYKSLRGESFKYFVQLLLDNQMYAATFKELNDPMEGAYILSKAIGKDLKDKIIYQKENVQIISLVEKKNNNDKPTNMLMWSHYADAHRGCCIEFHFENNGEDNVRSIKYVKEIASENDQEIKDINEVLLRKFVDWKYEDEVRHVGSTKFVPIKIDKIYLGMRIDDLYESQNRNREFYKNLIDKLLPTAQVVEMRAEDFDNKHIDTNSNYYNQ